MAVGPEGDLYASDLFDGVLYRISPNTIPSAITNLSLNAVSSSQVNLSWSTPADGGSPITSFQIFRTLNGAPFAPLITIPSGTSYSDTSLSSGNVVTYMVRAVNAIGPATPSNIPTPVTTSPLIITANFTASKDNTLYEDPAGGFSNGAGKNFFTGTTLQPGIRRTLIQFDLSSIPVGAVIDNSTLKLYMSKTITGPVVNTIHKVTNNWGEGTSDASGPEGIGAASTNGDATWIHMFYPNILWNNVGGDFVATATASKVINGTGFYVWNDTKMTSDVQVWVNNSTSNFGWLIKNADELTSPGSKRFDSRENISGKNPLLTVTYHIP